ncbi:hypothetical protein [Sphingomonas sp. DC1100-1]|uniref:hypothetical protein n=1 Tax=unclassified Sphingomonas TaxID=196159 RepID=UPI003CF43479
MIAEAVKHMLAAGMPHDAIVAAIVDMESCIAPFETRSKGAIRQARYEERKRQKASESVRSDATSSPEVSPNDIYSNPLPNPTTGAEAPSNLAQRVVEAWNEGPGKRGATTAKPLDAGRRKSLSLRLKEHDEAEVFEAISNIAASDFHCGKNDRGWTANIGWLLKSPENFQKALELQPRSLPAGANCNQPTDLVQEILRRQRTA